MTIRVLLADDQALFREGLETLLSVHKDIQVVGQAVGRHRPTQGGLRGGRAPRLGRGV